MTDARLPERFLTDRRVQRLSDPAYRLYVNARVWSVANRTDGVVHVEDLPLIPSADPDRADELEKAELWRRDRDRWIDVDFAGTQTSKHELEVLENARRRDREKKARQRAAAAEHDTSPGTVPRDVPRDVSPGQHRKAGRQERQAPTEKNHAGNAAHANGVNVCIDCGKLDPLNPIAGRCRSCHAKHERAS